MREKKKDKTNLNSKIFSIATSVDGSYKPRKWNWGDAVASGCFENTRKVIDVIYKTGKRGECSRKKRKLQSGSI